MGIDIKKVTKEVTPNAPGIILHSRGGLGKSTFVAQMCSSKANSLLIQCGEDSLSDLKDEHKKDVPHLEDIVGGGATEKDKIQGWHDFIDLLRQLIVEDHPYKLIAFDNLDNIINVNMDAFVIHEHYDGNVSKANSYGGQKIEELALYSNQIIEGFRMLQNKGITVVCTIHSHVVKSKDPLTDEFDMYDISMPARKDINIREIFINWASQVMFGTYDTVVVDKKAKGGQRVLKSDVNPAYKTKNRFDLPETIEFSYEAFKRAMSKDSKKKEDK